MDYTLGDVLQEVNTLRFYELSLPPLEKLPKGQCTRANTCVIARCFPDMHTDGDWLFWENDDIPLPITIREFISDFDQGLWPSLIEKNVSSIDSAIDVDSQTPILVTN